MYRACSKENGSRLRKLKSSGAKLPDGKPLGGKRRLTDVAIDNIQKFYGLAIRRNVGDVSQMKKAIWAEFFHFGSSDNNQLHFLCDKSWCKYMKAEEEGTIADVFDRMFILMVQMFQEMHIIIKIIFTYQ